MDKSWNATKLVLIPKVEHPVSARDFRPISCCNVLYKTITELLCTRLKKVVPGLVDQSQGAFVPGRELIYNLLMCQEMAKGYSRKHVSPRCMMKIDLKKAYDSIYWEFMEELMILLKFLTILSNG